MNEKPIEMTKSSVEALKSELKELVEVKLPFLTDRVAKAREQGDLSENSEYHSAKEEQELTNVRIDEIQQILKNVKLVAETSSTNKIGFGSEVVLEDEKGKKRDFVLVGEYADDAHEENTITSESPIGMAILGKAKGETVKVTVPSGEKVYKIIDIK